MAIPKKHESISNNLPLSQLEKVLKALEDESTEVVPGTYSIFNESGSWEVDFEGARYAIKEFVEEVHSVRLISAKSALLRDLIGELEASLSVVVNARNYDKAKEINDKIKDLTKMLRI